MGTRMARPCSSSRHTRSGRPPQYLCGGQTGAQCSLSALSQTLETRRLELSDQDSEDPLQTTGTDVFIFRSLLAAVPQADS